MKSDNSSGNTSRLLVGIKCFLNRLLGYNDELAAIFVPVGRVSDAVGWHDADGAVPAWNAVVGEVSTEAADQFTGGERREFIGTPERCEVGMLDAVQDVGMVAVVPETGPGRR